MQPKPAERDVGERPGAFDRKPAKLGLLHQRELLRAGWQHPGQALLLDDVLGVLFGRFHLDFDLLQLFPQQQGNKLLLISVHWGHLAEPFNRVRLYDFDYFGHFDRRFAGRNQAAANSASEGLIHRWPAKLHVESAIRPPALETNCD
jgi:hypothetical protein